MFECTPGALADLEILELALRKLRLLAIGIVLSALPLVAHARERCGWLENPKAGYWYLNDQQSRWVIAEGADYEAEGLDVMPDIYSGEYEPINRYYGYACACMDVNVDEISGQVTRINSYRSNPISFCEADPNMPLPRSD